jgi:hypothetical protein
MGSDAVRGGDALNQTMMRAASCIASTHRDKKSSPKLSKRGSSCFAETQISDEGDKGPGSQVDALLIFYKQVKAFCLGRRSPALGNDKGTGKYLNCLCVYPALGPTRKSEWWQLLNDLGRRDAPSACPSLCASLCIGQNGSVQSVDTGKKRERERASLSGFWVY